MEKLGAFFVMLIFSWPFVLAYLVVFTAAYALIGVLTAFIAKRVWGERIEGCIYILIGACQVFVFSFLASLTMAFVIFITSHFRSAPALPDWSPHFLRKDWFIIFIGYMPAFSLSWGISAGVLKRLLNNRSMRQLRFRWYLGLTIVPAVMSPFFALPLIIGLAMIKLS